MRKAKRWLTFFIIAFTLIALLIDLHKVYVPKVTIFGKTIGDVTINTGVDKLPLGREFILKQGLDLQGGSHLVLEADMQKIPEIDRETALESAKAVIERRVDLYGVTEPLIQTAIIGNSYRIIVELPGIRDVQKATELLGETAQLEFREIEETQSPEATMSGDFAYKPVELTGKDLRKAQVSTSTVSGGYEVALEFTDEGAKKFEAITERNVGKPVAIFLDQDMVSSPVVREKISGGRAVISGDFTVEQAKTLSIQLNAGALPVPIQIVEQDNVEATLGSQTVQKGAMAGLVGLFLVVAFMAAYYGKLGLIADLSLIIYGILTLAIYKFVPITLSMPGVAGFILSIGMAVDSNILIFERMKEEMRVGKPWDISMELGFGRAWDSIRDANIATIITSLILFNPFEWTFLNTSGPVRGFAITLLLGVLISLFTGIVVTRTLLRVLYRPSVKKGVAK